MTDNRNTEPTADSLTRRGFLTAAAAATVAVHLEPQGAPTSWLLDPRLQDLVGRQEQRFVIDSRTSTLRRFVLQHSQKTLRQCEASVQVVPGSYEVSLLGESAVLARVLPGLGFHLQAARLMGIDLDRHACRAEMPEEVLRISTRLFEALPGDIRRNARSPAVIDWPMLRLLEMVVDRFPDLDVSGSGPFGQLEVSLPDGGLRVERNNANDRMKLKVWVEDWRGLLLVPLFDGYRGLRRYVDALLDDCPGISTGGPPEGIWFLDDPAALVALIANIVAVGPVTIGVVPSKTELTATDRRSCL